MSTIIAGVFTIIFLAAVLGSMIGVGGGFLIVPLLTLLLNIPVHEAIALSLLSIVAVSSSAATTYALSKHIDFELGLLLEITTILGAYTGAHISLRLPSNILMVILGVVLIYAGYRFLRNIKYEEKRRDISTPKNKLILGITVSYIAGLMSGLIGIGGGILKMPILVLILNLPTRVAIGTSAFMITITSVSGSYVYYKAGIINYYLAGSAIIGALLGAQLGSRMGLKVKAKSLRKLFGIVLITFAIMMILKGVSASI